ncbi:MAG TPA: universal stress protein, partial [Gemmatimonadaceae bacterium]|nr:universal stress protein [Gemmatimonadaceae bacterium]
MTTESHSAASERQHAQVSSVVCAVAAGRDDLEAVRQAAVLAGPKGILEILCVTYSGGVGANATATISLPRAEAALESARRAAAELDVDASARLIHAPDAASPWRAIHQASAGHDLLVVGPHHGARTEGILIGSVTTEALHRSDLPVLVARRARTPFPERMVVATDGSPDSMRAADLAAGIAARHETSVELVTVGTTQDREHRHALGLEAARLFEGTRNEP